ncbi:MAG: c-type cytochrome [Bacteroidetes bacterium]|nr:c-type cytochrome [Bacteroidota bacterium]
MKRSVILFVLCLLLLTTCRKDVYNPDVCFNENILPIFISNCTMSGCHNSIDKEEGYDLTNYDGIMQGISPKHPLTSTLYNAIRGKNPYMPPNSNPKLSSKDVAYVKIWIEMGAQNTSNCNECDTSSFSFNNRIQPVFQSWCVGCHNSSNAGGSVILTDYANATSTKALDKMLGSIKHLQGYYAMPKSGSQLPPCEINAIEKWLNQGHPNN